MTIYYHKLSYIYSVIKNHCLAICTVKHSVLSTMCRTLCKPLPVPWELLILQRKSDHTKTV